VTVSGTVKFEGNVDKLPRGAVVFRKQDTGEIISARSGNEGQIEEQLFPGKYIVTAAYSPYLMKDLSVKGAKLTGRVIEVSGQSPITVNVTMSKEVARVEGVVKAEDADAPVSGAMVVLVPEDAANELPLFRRYQSDTDGSFTFTNVLPGKYTLLALRKGWDLEWGRPDVLREFLAGGEPLEVAPSGRVKVNVKPQ
jgi:hypothetical protein